MKTNCRIKKLFLFMTSMAICLLSTAQVGPINIGTLPKNKTVKIVYDVTVANPVSPANTTQLSHQGTVSGTNFTSVLTDDPDAAGYPHDPAMATITLIDLPPSVVSINRQTPLQQLTNATTVVYRVTFSESVSNVDITDFALHKTSTVDGTIASVSASTGTSIDVTVNSITGNGDMRLDLNASGTGIVDAGTNPIIGGFTTGEIYTFDHTLPTLTNVTIASNNANSAYAKVGDIVTLSFTASELLTGTPTATIATHSVTVTPGGGSSYTATYTMLVTDAEGLVAFTINFTDEAGNAGTQVTATTNSSTVTFDKTSPAVTINQAAGQPDPSTASTINFTVVFDEPVTGFGTVDITLSGTAGATTANVTEIAPNNGTTFNVEVSGMTVTGTVIASVGAGVATDAAGNSNAASTSTDNTVDWVACQITCPQNITVDATADQCGAIVNYDPATTTGNCGTLTYSKASGSFFDVGTTTVTVTSASTGQSCSFTVTVNDKQAPAIDCPANKTVNTDENVCTALVSFAATATDNCSSATIKYYLNYGTLSAQEITSPYTFNKGTTTVTVKATDASENSSTCSFTVKVEDHQPPSITAPPDVTQYTGADATTCGKYIPESDIGSSDFWDNCVDGITMVQFPNDNIFPVGTTAIVYIATDGSGNTATATQNVTVVDNTKPTLTGCPSDITAYTGASATSCNKAVSWTAPSFSDNCSVESLTSNYSPGELFAKGETTVTYIVKDVHGNENSCSFKVTVIDNTPPAIIGSPSNQTVYTGVGSGGCTQTATWTEPTATDNCDGALTYFSRSHAPGSTFPKGSTTVTYVFKDAAGNASSCSFDITVVDNTPPQIVCHTDIRETAPEGSCSKVVTFNTTASDNCEMASLVVSPTSGSSFPLGVTTVKATATDNSGNTATCSFTVTITDATSPSFSTNLTVSPVTIWPPDHKMKNITLTYTVTDNCAVTNTIVVTSTDPITGVSDGDKFPDWIVVDDHHIQLRAERGNGKEARVYTIQVITTDASGNSATSNVGEVRIAHNITAPITGSPFLVNSTVNFAGVFWDKPGNKHTANWTIDDNISVKGTVTEPSGMRNGKVSGSYKFTSTGIYRLQMNVTDQNRVTSYCNTNEDLEEIVVIYDPHGGYAYGGGWFNSPAGSLTADPTATGKVSYGFSVNYYKAATPPRGETQFEFKVGELQYNALNFEYLSLSGYKAVFKGLGKIIGGQSGISFMMYVIDGALDGTGVDKVRIKIYNKNTGHVYYDNQPGASDAADPVTPVGINSTVVLQTTNQVLTKGKINQAETIESTKLEAYALPNPTNTSFRLTVRSNNLTNKIVMQVVDIYGRIIEVRNVSANETLQLGDTYRPGTYIVKVVQAGKTEQLKLIKLPN